MKYFRVKKDYDQRNKNPRIRDGRIYVGGELYTAKEIERQKLNLAYMEPVEVSQRKIFWCFGCRFIGEEWRNLK